MRLCVCGRGQGFPIALDLLERMLNSLMQTLLLIAVALFAGLLMTRLFVKFHLPDVTAYLVAGVLIGPCVLGRDSTLLSRSIPCR